MRVKTYEAAVGRWYGILAEFGMDDRQLSGKHCECPLCGGKDRFRFDDKDGRGTFFCNGCGAGDGIKLAGLLTGLDFKELAKQIDGMVGNIDAVTPRPKKDPAVRLRKIHSELHSIDGVTPVRRYLKSRGLTAPPQSIFYHPAMMNYVDGRPAGNHPAMVAIFRNSEGKPITYHVTYLSDGGDKAAVESARKILPPTEKMTGGAIRLFPAAERMGVAEGIETALAASELHDIPVWACATAGLLEAWIKPDVAREVVIFGDNDKSYTGQSAAYRLANRLALEGVSVSVEIPTVRGDWNDVLMGAA